MKEYQIKCRIELKEGTGDYKKHETKELSILNRLCIVDEECDFEK